MKKAEYSLSNSEGKWVEKCDEMERDCINYGLGFISNLRELINSGCSIFCNFNNCITAIDEKIICMKDPSTEEIFFVKKEANMVRCYCKNSWSLVTHQHGNTVGALDDHHFAALFFFNDPELTKSTCEFYLKHGNSRFGNSLNGKKENEIKKKHQKKQNELAKKFAIQKQFSVENTEFERRNRHKGEVSLNQVLLPVDNLGEDLKKTDQIKCAKCDEMVRKGVMFYKCKKIIHNGCSRKYKERRMCKKGCMSDVNRPVIVGIDNDEIENDDDDDEKFHKNKRIKSSGELSCNSNPPNDDKLTSNMEIELDSEIYPCFLEGFNAILHKFVPQYEDISGKGSDVMMEDEDVFVNSFFVDDANSSSGDLNEKMGSSISFDDVSKCVVEVVNNNLMKNENGDGDVKEVPREGSFILFNQGSPNEIKNSISKQQTDSIQILPSLIGKAPQHVLPVICILFASPVCVDNVRVSDGKKFRFLSEFCSLISNLRFGKTCDVSLFWNSFVYSFKNVCEIWDPADLFSFMLFKFNEHFFKKSIDLNLSSFFFLSEMDYFVRHKHFLEEKEVFSKDEISFSEIFASEVKKMGTCEESEVICFLLDRYESTCNFIDFSFLTPVQRKALGSVRHF